MMKTELNENKISEDIDIITFKNITLFPISNVLFSDGSCRNV